VNVIRIMPDIQFVIINLVSARLEGASGGSGQPRGYDAVGKQSKFYIHRGILF